MKVLIRIEESEVSDVCCLNPDLLDVVVLDEDLLAELDDAYDELSETVFKSGETLAEFEESLDSASEDGVDCSTPFAFAPGGSLEQEDHEISYEPGSFLEGVLAGEEEDD
jgi:hypothetical protein